MTDHQVALLLLDLALIVALAAVGGFVARRLRQPAVVGEIVAGIAIGPTLFGGVLAQNLFPADIRPFLNTLANVGLALFMFLVGMGIEHTTSRGTRRHTAAVSIGASALPFGLGVALAIWLLGHHEPANRTGFVLFIGVTLSITAFPVLARIVAERNLSRTAVGTIALSAAAICDIAAWTALALVQAITGQNYQAHWQTLLLIPFVAAMFGIVRPVLKRFLTRNQTDGTLSATTVTVIFIGTLSAAAATQLMGLHLVFGAFLFGLIMPRPDGTALRETITRPIEFATRLLLPVYFVITGLNVDLSRLGATGLLDLCLIMALAIVGKCAGAYASARLSGLSSHQSAVLATLMNTRGLTELIALGVGLQIGLLDQQLYGAMVLMAVITTAMAGPLLTYLTHRSIRSGIDAFGNLTPPTTRQPPSARSR